MAANGNSHEMRPMSVASWRDPSRTPVRGRQASAPCVRTTLIAENIRQRAPNKTLAFQQVPYSSCVHTHAPIHSRRTVVHKT